LRIGDAYLINSLVNRWLNIRFNMLSTILVGLTSVICLVSPNVSASLAGFVLTFVSTIDQDLLGMVSQDM
jgi:hypothetical protein